MTINPIDRFVRVFSVLCIAATLVSGCGNDLPALTATADVLQTATAAQQTATPAPEPTPLQALSIEAAADPSLAAADVTDPSAEINKYLVDIYHPDSELYNALYHAVINREKSFDLTGYDLTLKEKVDIAGCLYGERNYRFFYLKNLKVNKDGKKVTFTYTGTPEENARDSTAFCARLSHVLYDVLPEDYSDLQKVVSLYDYICRISDYAEKMSEESTQTPYSILMKGQGICRGYADLTRYALDHAGVTVEYVSNEAHAWDIVKLNGNWHHTDVTWGAGAYRETYNYLNALFMDDARRHKGLADQGYDGRPTILGVPRDNPELPPACTDTSLDAYKDAGCMYALDIEGGKVYFASPNGGIDCMNLDCTGRETLTTKIQPNLMAFFNGALYFTNSYDCCLYKMVPGQQAELLYDAEPTLYLKLEGATLKYSPDAAGFGCKEMKLLPFDRDAAAGAETFPAATVPEGRSFGLHVRFSAPADASQNWNERVYLVDAAGKAIPLHFALSADGTELTIRPKDCVADRGSLSLYVTGVSSADGTKMEGYQRLDVTVGSPQ